MSPPWLAIVNPAAGSGRARKLAPPALARLRREGLRLDSVVTTAAGEAGPLARAAYDRGVRDFLAVGGDGTSFEVLQGLPLLAADPGARVRLGFLPLGTGNSFLRDFTGAGVEHCIAALLADRRRACDVLSIACDRATIRSLNLCALGFVAEVGDLTNRRFKTLGAAGYVGAVVAKIATLSAAPIPFRKSSAGPFDREPLTFLALCNSRFTGGAMQMAPEARTDDGFLELVRVGAMSRLELLATFPRIFGGTHVEHPKVQATRAVRVELDLPGAVPLLIDGEIVIDRPRAVEVLPRAIDVCA